METMENDLPEVPDETLDRLEARVMLAIREEKRPAPIARRRRRFLWTGIGIAAAIVAVAAVISPAVTGGLGSVRFESAADGSAGGSSAESAPERGPASPEGGDASGPQSADGSAVPDSAGAAPDQATAPAEREIVRSGSASVVVDDAARAAQEIVDLATDHGGWVEQLSIGADRSFTGPEQTGDSAVWVPDDGGFVSIRVPADDLDAVMASLEDVGEVASTRVGTEDVTTAAVDLRARIDAARASVDRLTDLLAKSGNVGDLVQVESTLSQRQGELESLEQQLKTLEGQVAMSTLSVSLLTEAPPVKADPAGFGDGLAAGWDGLLATLNGIVIGLGFLLPWLGVAAVVLVVIWIIRKAIRRRRPEA